MNRFRLSELVLLFLLAAVPRHPQASVIAPMSVDDLVASADEIVVGRVLSVSAAWNASHTRIASTVEVEVQERWKGTTAPKQRLSIVQPGGTVGEIEMTVHGLAAFTSGETALLFLQGRARYRVVGMAQGKKSLQWDAMSRRWLAAGLLPGAASDRVPLDKLREQVRAATQR